MGSWLSLIEERFLFQTGSIKSKLRYLQKEIVVVCFYSRLVRLKDIVIGDGIFVSLKGFYSRLVRLKEFAVFSDTMRERQFLFQTGSIKRNIMYALRAFRESFYSRLVRLKAIFYFFPQRPNLFLFQTGSIKSGMPVRKYQIREWVSIPDWFD